MAVAVAKKRKRKLREEEVFEEDDLDFDMDDDDDEEEESSRPVKKKPKASGGLTDPKLTKALQKLQDIEKDMSLRLFERETQLRDLFLALLSKENILLLGPPGTGKTLFAKEFSKHIEDSRIFSYMFNKTSDPSDFMGPYSVKQMENDKFLRITDGFLPNSHVSFLDEVFKANAPSLNILLPLMNERTYINGGVEHKTDLRIVIGASNEFPESDELNAFYDRFLFRHWVDYVKDPANRVAMGRASRGANNNILPSTTITLKEIDMLQAAVKLINFPKQVEELFDKMYRTLQDKGIVISDRRYNKAQYVMMANALFSGRSSVSTEDFTVLTYILWDKNVKDIPIIEAELGKFVNPYESKVKELFKKADELTKATISIENRTERAGQAVTASSQLQEIIAKITDEINDAKSQGVDVTKLNTMLKDTQDFVNEISTKCLQQSSSASSWKK